MLDTDEAAGFDEAMRHDPELKRSYQEMQRLAAAVAVTSSVPVQPRAGQLESLHLRLGLNTRKSTNWAGITGWGAAAVLAIALIVNRAPNSGGTAAVENSSPAAGQTTVVEAIEAAPAEEQEIAGSASYESSEAPTPVVEIDGTVVTTLVKTETKRLIQEIEILRGRLENLQQRDRERLEPVAGMAWPIVMRMSPPEETTAIAFAPPVANEDPPLTEVLGDALSAAGSVPMETRAMAPASALAAPPPPPDPSAIPVYDAASDNGTLVVSSLPLLGGGEAYNLWVTTGKAGKPIHVGRLPESMSSGAESFDFSLGSTGVVPSSFVLTKDPAGTPSAPSEHNTVLQGPR